MANRPRAAQRGFIPLLGRFGTLGFVHRGQIDLDDATEDLVDPDREHLGEAEQPGYRHRALAPLVGAERRGLELTVRAAFHVVQRQADRLATMPESSPDAHRVWTHHDCSATGIPPSTLVLAPRVRAMARPA